MKIIHHKADGSTSENAGNTNIFSSLSNYAPLVALVGVAVLTASALHIGTDGGEMAWMHYFMGIFLCQFALVKLFDLKGFAEGFAKYDLLGARSRLYALSYPFLELGIGLLYLCHIIPLITYGLTIILLGFGAIGVIRSLQKGRNLNCACMGSVLKVPLSHVTLGEDLGMAAMAFLMLLSVYF